MKATFCASIPMKCHGLNENNRRLVKSILLLIAICQETPVMSYSVMEVNFKRLRSVSRNDIMSQHFSGVTAARPSMKIIDERKEK